MIDGQALAGRSMVVVVQLARFGEPSWNFQVRFWNAGGHDIIEIRDRVRDAKPLAKKCAST